MFSLAVTIMIGIVCLSEILYIVFRNPLINHFNRPILLLAFTGLLLVLGLTELHIVLGFISSVLIISAAFLSWKFPHQAFEKPDWRYLIVLIAAFISLLFL